MIQLELGECGILLVY